MYPGWINVLPVRPKRLIKLLANENFPLASTKILQKQGFDIKAIGTDNPSILDPEVIKIAEDEERTIITFDKDYGELIYKHGYKPKAGVIFLRILDTDPEGPGKFLMDIFKNTDLEFNRKLTIIDRDKIRQRKY